MENLPVGVWLEFVNAQSAGLGIALPALARSEFAEFALTHSPLVGCPLLSAVVAFRRRSLPR